MNWHWEEMKQSPSYNNSRCVYIYIFPVPRIVATALNIWENNEIFLLQCIRIKDATHFAL